MSKFKAGDKVVIVKPSLPQWRKKYTVDVVCSKGFFTKEEGGLWFYHNSAELVEDTSTWHPHHDCIVAWAKGAKIEYFSTGEDKWIELRTNHVGWHPEYKYRIKPEKTEKELEIERIEKEMRKLADDLEALK